MDLVLKGLVISSMCCAEHWELFCPSEVAEGTLCRQPPPLSFTGHIYAAATAVLEHVCSLTVALPLNNRSAWGKTSKQHFLGELESAPCKGGRRRERGGGGGGGLVPQLPFKRIWV